ncbi:serine/arginine repetitive matrix protein 2 [Drosophila eugracilis]|uniref:serine/arginine repetitive matrix protein 2 n=1 Tax=Drosophila eugracilis TaxID=29029 RepID=UPI001BDB5A3D|nr:serine/arginine repetitive matrix protein 2 [Drosophila eugracilis]
MWRHLSQPEADETPLLSRTHFPSLIRNQIFPSRLYALTNFTSLLQLAGAIMRDRGQVGPNGSLDGNNRSQRNCPSHGTDLVSTPEHLRPGFRGHRAHRYDPSDFGLTGNEEWRHPRMFRDMTYETDAAAMETFRQAQPRRPPYEMGINLSNLPEEYLADMSAPGFDLSLPSQMSEMRGELLDDVSAPNMYDVSNNGGTSHADNVYDDILDRFKSIKERINRTNQLHRTGDSVGMQELTTHRRIYTHRDPSGNITSHVDETTVSNTSSMDFTPAIEGGEPGRRLNFSLPSRFESQLMDESMPSYHDASMPNECLEVMSSQDNLENETMPAFESSFGPTLRSQNILSRRQLTMPSECLDDVTQPSFERSRSRRQSHPRRLNQLSMASQNLWDVTAPSFGNTTAREQTNNECLEDISMPAFEGVVSNVSRSRSLGQRQRSRNTRNISEISAPIFASSRRGQMTNECLDDMTMPSFGGISNLSTNRSHRQLQRSMSNGNINDISQPTFVSFSRGPMTNECLDEVTMPSFGGMPMDASSMGRMSRRQSLSRREDMPSECLDDMTMPSFGGISRASRSQSLDRHLRSMPSRRMTNECLDDMTMPSFGGVSGSSGRQMTLPSECLNDVSAPSFGRSSSRGSSRRQKSMSAKNICDTSAPSFANTIKYGDECLEDMTMPSFGGVSGSSRRRSSMRQPMSLPSQNIGDISAPSLFGSSGRGGNTTNECLEDISMPSFGGISSTSRRRSRSRKRQSKSQQISSNISNSSKSNSRRHPMTNECLDDMTMPSMGGVSVTTRRQMTLPSECLNDVSAPSFERSLSRSASRRQRTLPAQNPCASSTRCPPTNECLEDITMPSFGGVSSAASGRRQQMTMPSECLEDMSTPSFGGISGPSRRQTTALPDECIEDISMPTFGNISDVCQSARDRSRSIGRSGRSKRNSEFLEDVTMPSFGGISSSSRRKSISRRQTKTSQPPQSDPCESMRTNECLEDMTMPSYGEVTGISVASSSQRQRTMSSRRRGQMTSECLDDQTMPSFGGISQQSGRRTPRRQTASYAGPPLDTNECLENITMPSFAENTQATRSRSFPSECLEDMTMPSCRENTGSFRGRSHPTPRQSSRQECLDDMTMPSFGASSHGYATNECLEDISMPNFGEITGSSRGRSPMPVQSLRQATMTNECLDDMTMPSFGNSYRGRNTNECLEDISMPSYGGNSGFSRGRSPMAMQRSNQGAQTTECLDDMTMPSFGSPNRRTDTNECLGDISMPSYLSNSGANSSRGWRSTTPRQGIKMEAMTNECLDDMTMPSFGSPSRGPRTNECLDGSRASHGRTPKQIQIYQGPMTNECLENMTMPSFGTLSRSAAATNECLEDVSMPSYSRNTDSFPGRSRTPRQISRQEMMTNECLDDMTMPSYDEIFGSSRRQMTMPSECLNDVTEPSFVRSTSQGSSRRRNIIPSRGKSPRPNSMSMTNNECLEDMTMPTFGDVSGSSRQRHGQSTMNSVRLEDISMPSGLANRTQYSGEVCEEDNVSGVRGRGRTNECLEDVSAPSFAASSHMTSRCLPQLTNECLEDVSMPMHESSLSRNDSKSIARRPPDISYPSQMLANESAPSFAAHSRRDEPDKSADCSCSGPQQTSRSRPWENDNVACLEDVTMPTFEDVSYQPRRHQLSMPCENLDDQTQPDFFNSTALPSSTRAERHNAKSPRLELDRNVSKQLADESMPSILKDTTKGPSEVVKEVTVQSSKTSVTRIFNKKADASNTTTGGGQPMIEDLSMPQFEATGVSSHADAASLHGFQSMDNYMPFNELIYSQNSVGNNQSQPETPQPARAARSRNRSRATRTPSSRAGGSTSASSTSPTSPVTSATSPSRTPGQPCDSISTNYPYGKPHCYSRKPPC